MFYNNNVIMSDGRNRLQCAIMKNNKYFLDEKRSFSFLFTEKTLTYNNI